MSPKNRWFFVAALGGLGALGCGRTPAGTGNGPDGAGGSAPPQSTSGPAGPDTARAQLAAGSGWAAAAGSGERTSGGSSGAGAASGSSTGQSSASAAISGNGGRSAAASGSAGDSAAASGSVGDPAAASGSAGDPAAASGSGVAGMAGAAAAPSQAQVSIDAGIYTFSRGRCSLAVDAMHGARITRFGLDDYNLLTGPDVDMLNYGSTFWPSPQERWSWPPVPELDSEAYEAKQEADVVTFTSKAGMRAKVSVSKRIRALSEDSVEITYSLVNNDVSAVSWAAWEITRVAASGLSFFPTGTRQVGTQLPVTDQGGVTWFQHDPAKIMGDGQKFTGDGAEGWLAHLAGRFLLVKQFMDVPADAQAPAPEAEIALYAARGYVEIEPQGPYTMLMPGEALTWTVRWFVAELPAQVPTELGSTALLDFVRQLLARSSM